MCICAIPIIEEISLLGSVHISRPKNNFIVNIVTKNDMSRVWKNQKCKLTIFRFKKEIYETELVHMK